MIVVPFLVSGTCGDDRILAEGRFGDEHAGEDGPRFAGDIWKSDGGRDAHRCSDPIGSEPVSLGLDLRKRQDGLASESWKKRGYRV